MIHYIDGVPLNIIKMNTTKRHARENYRHKQRLAAAKDIAIRFAIVLVVGAILSIVYLIRTA